MTTSPTGVPPGGSPPAGGRPSAAEHWGSAWEADPGEKSWYQARPTASLELIGSTGAPEDRSLVDVGGGASTLVDHLLAAGWTDLTVVDIAAGGLDAARQRLGPTADRVDWVVADVLTWEPGRTFDVWHDRALFHFLTDPAGRAAYRRVLDRALAPGGHAVVATFAEDGPEQCSGLPTTRWSPDALAAELAALLDPVRFVHEDHRTPWDSTQRFLYGLFRRPAA